MMLLSTAYFGNIQYYSKLLSGDKIVMEQHENYIKQSYRNRCDILSSNGVMSLSIPVKKDPLRTKIPIKDVEIEYVMSWQKQHWRSVSSAYGSSPFFEFYDYLFEPLYNNQEKYLFDFNQKCMDVVVKCLKTKVDIEYSDDFYEDGVAENDYRYTISPKQDVSNDNRFVSVDYYQVFAEKMEFLPNLSILDLLFCEGNETLPILKKSLIL